MIVLGIDPGKATSGYSVVRFDGQEIFLLDFGWIETPKEQEATKRLLSIGQQTEKLIKKAEPDILAIERLFFFINAKTAMGVSEAIGVMKMIAAKNKLPMVEYAPLHIKKIVTGNGKSKKKDVQEAVRKIVKIRCPKKKKTHFNDVADAVAVAICHIKKTKGGEKIG